MHSILLEKKNNLLFKQELLINFAMEQAFQVMQLPLLELAEWLHNEIENNPLLEMDIPRDRDASALDGLGLKNLQKNEPHLTSVWASVSLYEHLVKQAPLVLENSEDLHLAELVIGHLNEKGFLDVPLEQIAPSVSLEKLKTVLKIIQTFDPPGIAAQNLQDSFLLQLKSQRKENSLAFKIIEKHFNSLVKNHLPHISKKLNISLTDLIQTIQRDIATLSLNPASGFTYQPTIAIVPDLFFHHQEGNWSIQVNTAFLPKFHIAPIYLKTLRENSLEKEEYHYLCRKLSGGKWLKKIVQKRNHTLYALGNWILKKQQAFFNSERGTLSPMTAKEAAGDLSLNESTITRCIANKYLACPQGTFLLRSLFKQGIQKYNGDAISNHSILELLNAAIDKEDKRHPMTDALLTKKLKQLGIFCARRTVAKYRNALKIPSTCKRKKFF